jgi:hypothetical protein
MPMDIKSPLRLILLAGVFLVLFFAFIAQINNVSSLSVARENIDLAQKKERNQRVDHLLGVTKKLNEELARNSENETLLRVKPEETRRLQRDGEPNPAQMPQNSGIVAR